MNALDHLKAECTLQKEKERKANGWAQKAQVRDGCKTTKNMKEKSERIKS